MFIKIKSYKISFYLSIKECILSYHTIPINIQN